MSDRKRNRIHRNSKAFRIRFSSRNLTSSAGLALLYRFWQQLGGETRINERFSRAKRANASYSVGRICTIILMGLLRGARHISHLALLGHDGALRKLWDWLSFPVATTLTRTLDLFGYSGSVQLADLTQELRQKVWNRKWLGRVTLDLDSSVRTTYGHQEGAERGYNPHHPGKRSYHPQLAFIAETGEILQGWLRSGDTHSSNGSVAFLREALSRLPKQVWKVVLRADSGYFNGALLDFLEQAGVSYVIKCKMKNYRQFCERHAKWRKSGEKRWTADFMVALPTWTRARRFVAVRELVDTQEDLFGPVPVYSYRLWVTDQRLSPNNLEAYYNQRATCEQWIDHGKNQMGWAGMRGQNFWTNETLFQLGLLAYNLLVWFKRRLLPAGLQGQEVETVRRWLICTAGRVIHSGRRWILDLGRDNPWKEVWQSIDSRQNSAQPF